MIMNGYTKAAVDVARKAGEYVLSRERGPIEIHEKISSYDYVTDVDTKSEAIIRETLHELFPDHGFAGEEQNQDNNELKYHLTHMGEDEYCWLVDPLDGTINFIHGLGGYAVSIALLKNSEIISGAIYLPTRGEMFYAQKDGGMWLNGKQARVSQSARLADALIADSIPTTNMDYRRYVLKCMPDLAMGTFNLRMIGSAAASIAYTACGRVDGYIEVGHYPWDVAAGMLMVAEAGGHLTNHLGDRLSLADPKLIASNGRIHGDLLSIMGHED